MVQSVNKYLTMAFCRGVMATQGRKALSSVWKVRRRIVRDDHGDEKKRVAMTLLLVLALEGVVLVVSTARG